ncbi:unnamed protein product [Arabidopsis thaliana]|uniref:DUF1204 domain-containing protein n=1 Tax=Arabidopsis thaliana TaxID=3702 RepID=A0A5S9XAT7_ARATH|nr:unnamed protein product [Arabidopsis thaliana]
MSGKDDNLVERAYSGRKELRERRLEYVDFVQRSAVDKMAELIEKRLDRIKTYIDDTKVAEPKFLNSIVYGNIKTLEALIEGGEVKIKSNEMMSRLDANVELLKAEVTSINIRDLMVGGFGSSKEDDDHADGRDGQEGRVGEQIIDQVVVHDETTGVDG